jgi:hypothetical protein
MVGDSKKGAAASRAKRLEAQLRANLKKRKDQARARARGASEAEATSPASSDEGGE